MATHVNGYKSPVGNIGALPNPGGLGPKHSVYGAGEA